MPPLTLPWVHPRCTRHPYHAPLLLLLITFISSIAINIAANQNQKIPVGVILDMQSSIGKMTRTCISMALQDFYQKHSNHTTIIVPHFRDSEQDNVQAASTAIDLLKNIQVIAILGPLRSSQADFVIDIGNKSNVPILSPATSPSLSPKENLYFIRTAHNSSSQAHPIAAFVKSFSWREVVFVYEDGHYGTGPIPYLSHAMLSIGAKVKYCSILSSSASDDWILEELYKLKTMQTRVFVVHMLPALASRFFKRANEAGMMEKGYAWIITEVLTSLLHSLDSTDIDSMQGVLGVKSYVPRSKELINFEKRWKRRFRSQNPEIDVTELDMFGIWSYDSIFALAMSLERVASQTNTAFRRQRNPTTDLDAIGTSEMGSRLLPWIRNLRLEGLSGDFHVVDGQLQSTVYQIVNIIGNGVKPIGYWTPEIGISKKLTRSHQTERGGDSHGAIIWPGDTHAIPKGWEIPTSNEKKLRVGVPAKGGFVQFVDANTDPQTKQVKVTGFCMDVFKAVTDALPYAVAIEPIPFVTPDGKRPLGTYNDLVYEIFKGTYDAVIGDITILANRSKYVDFTLPYTEGGVSMIVPIKVDERKNAWIFMRPLEVDLWITTGAFFIYTGVVIWVLEHRVNKEFRGPPHQQVGMIFWFSFSTLVFAHKEKMISNLSRFVVIVWIFVVLVLTSSYTASLTSMLTVQQLQPAYTDMHEIMRKGELVGYQDGSFVAGMLKEMGFDGSKLRNYSTFEEYDKALAAGSQNGGVSAIVDELPYIKLFLNKYCTKYTMSGPTYKTAGFGFAFPKGSPLVTDVSTAILQVTEGNMSNISKQWLGDAASCDEHNGATVTSNRLTMDSFKGLFIIAGLSSTSALMLFLFIFLYENRETLASQGSIRQRLAAIAKTFDEVKDDESRRTGAVIDSNNSPAVIVHLEAAGVYEGFSSTEPGTPFEGFSSTEPGTPLHDIVETTIGD